jgi:hypothetical protein
MPLASYGLGQLNECNCCSTAMINDNPETDYISAALLADCDVQLAAGKSEGLLALIG